MGAFICIVHRPKLNCQWFSGPTWMAPKGVMQTSCFVFFSVAVVVFIDLFFHLNVILVTFQLSMNGIFVQKMTDV